MASDDVPLIYSGSDVAYISFGVILLGACGSETAGLETPQPPVTVEVPQEQEIELAVLMFRLQVHADKLWHSGEAQNWPLAGFYIHEIEETVEEIAQAKIVEDGHNISALVGMTSIQSPLRAMSKSVEAEDEEAFAAAYVELVDGCNSCHGETDHGFIHIQIPSSPALSNQRFELPDE